MSLEDLFNLLDRVLLLPFGSGQDNDVVVEPLVEEVGVAGERTIKFDEIKFGQDRGERAAERDALIVCPPAVGDEDGRGDDLLDQVENDGPCLSSDSNAVSGNQRGRT